jgi:hypothetical protein
VITPFAKLAKAILWRAAKDMTPERGQTWLVSDTCKDLCEQAGVNHDEFTDAMNFILAKSDIQRALLLQNLRKNIGA